MLFRKVFGISYSTTHEYILLPISVSGCQFLLVIASALVDLSHFLTVLGLDDVFFFVRRGKQTPGRLWTSSGSPNRVRRVLYTICQAGARSSTNGDHGFRKAVKDILAEVIAVSFTVRVRRYVFHAKSTVCQGQKRVFMPSLASQQNCG